MRNNISLGRLLKKASLALVTALMISVPLYAAIDIYEFDSPEQEAMFHQLGKELRCPKCQNNNIADSNAALAQDLRMKVYEMLKQGKSEKEIIDYMVARYGNFVTYNPPMTFSTAILWVGPFGFLIIGFAVLVIRSRRKNTVAAEQSSLSDAEQKRLDALLNDKDSENDKADNR